MIRLIPIVIGLAVLWWLTTLLPLPHPFPLVMQVVIVLCLIWEFLAVFGVVASAVPVWRTRTPP